MVKLHVILALCEGNPEIDLVAGEVVARETFSILTTTAVIRPNTIIHLFLGQTTQSALEFCPIHCPNGRLGQDLGFGGSAFALKLPELLNRNLAAVRAKLGQTSCFPNGPQI